MTPQDGPEEAWRRYMADRMRAMRQEPLLVVWNGTRCPDLLPPPSDEEIAGVEREGLAWYHRRFHPLPEDDEPDPDEEEEPEG